jgi:hypothetical protein
MSLVCYALHSANFAHTLVFYFFLRRCSPCLTAIGKGCELSHKTNAFKKEKTAKMSKRKNGEKKR